MTTGSSVVAPVSREDQSSYVRLHGRWPLVMRGVWLITLAVTLAIVIAGFPLYLRQLGTSCSAQASSCQQLTSEQFARLVQIGITPSIYVALSVALAMIGLVVSWSLSAVIIWRRPDDWMAALVALLLILLGPIPINVVLPAGRLLWLDPYHMLGAVQLVMLAAVFSLFPSGRFAPRWTRWVLVAVLLAGVVVIGGSPYFGPSGALGLLTPIGPLGFVISAIEMVALTFGQILRYRQISTPLQRQQTKWVVIGLCGLTAYFVGLIVGVLLFPALWAHAPISSLFAVESAVLLPIFLAISFALATLRYRLWEIDRLINRALVYGALTVILTGLYAGLVIGLQTLSRGLIGQDNSLVIVLSTLAIAALVLPLRRWLQAFIDRAFYRNHFDSTRTLEAFSASLRHEIRVEALREQLLRVVDETMRPAHASLWLRATPIEGETVRRPGE